MDICGGSWGGAGRGSGPTPREGRWSGPGPIWAPVPVAPLPETRSSMLAAAVRIGLEELVSAVWTFIKDYEYKSVQKHIRRQLITDRAKHKNRKELEQSAQTEIGAAFYLLVRKPTGEELAIQAHSEADYYHAALQHAIDELQKMKGGAQ